MYQVYDHSLPEQLTSLLGTRNVDNNFELRCMNGDSFLIRYNSVIGRNSVRHRGPMAWNSSRQKSFILAAFLSKI